MRSFRLASSAIVALLLFATARSAESEDRPLVPAATPTVITGVGIVESTLGGFRFPDTSLQLSAALPSTTAPLALGDSSSVGTATTFAREDHVHTHGNRPGGALHALATTSQAGFLSPADKIRLDSAPTYVRTVVVSPIPGDAIASGTALRNALAAISGVSATNRYLLKIEPGVFDIGNAVPLAMRDFIDIEGSGENATLIKGSVTDLSVADPALIIGASKAELRELTVTNYGGNGTSGAYGFLARDVTTTIRDVTINVMCGVEDSEAVGIRVEATLPNILTLRNTNIYAHAQAAATASGVVATPGTTVAIQGGSITASGGSSNFAVHAHSSVVTIDNSVMSATDPVGDGTALLVDRGLARVRHSTLVADGAGDGTGLGDYTGVRTLHESAIVSIEHSEIRALTLALDRAEESILRVATSQIIGGQTGYPLCVFSYYGEFLPLSENCEPPS